MYAVTRTYTGASALIDALEKKRGDVERLISSTPGFVSYYAFRSGDGMTSISVFDDRAGAEESSRRAAQWVRENVSNADLGAPQIAGGDVFLEFGAHAAAHGGTRA